MMIIYGGFWRRITAFFLDGFILFCIPIFILVIPGGIKISVIASQFVISFLIIFYQLFFLKQFGATIGMLLMKLEVVLLNGCKLSWKEVILRSLVSNVLLILILLIMVIYSINNKNEIEFANILTKDFFYSFFSNFNMFWTFSEFFVLLTNKKRRSFQDYMAGTVVIRKLKILP